MRHECETCFSAVFPRTRDVVECHYNAPKPEATHAPIDWRDAETWPVARWPIVDPTDWCGWWAPRVDWQEER